MKGHAHYTARGSEMFFKAVAGLDDGDLAMDAYFAALHELWNRAEPPAPDEERALMSRFGMDPA